MTWESHDGTLKESQNRKVYNSSIMKALSLDTDMISEISNK